MALGSDAMSLRAAAAASSAKGASALLARGTESDRLGASREIPGINRASLTDRASPTPDSGGSPVDVGPEGRDHRVITQFL